MNPILFKTFFIIRKNLYWLLLLGFIFMLFAYMSNVILNQNKQLSYTKKVYEDTQNDLRKVSNILSQKRNELGQQETKVKALVGDKKALQLLISQNSNLAEQLKALKVDVKDLRSVTSLKVTSSGQFTTITRDSIVEKIVEVYVGDTIRQDTIRERLTLINYKEPQGWFTMTGTINGDTMRFNPSFYEEYEMLIHDERKPKRYFLDLFRGKQTVGTVISKNPYIQTNNVKVIVQDKPKKGFFKLF